MKIILTGGGTGGHIYPALALAKKIIEKDPTSKILYIGAKRGIETKIVPDADIDFIPLEIKGLSRKNPFENIKTLLMLKRAVKKASQIVKDFKPDVVVGMGGYASAPTMIAAQENKIPTIIHEQNLAPGFTNRLLAQKANRVATSFTDTKKNFPIIKNKIVLTGNPRGQEVADENDFISPSELGLKKNKKTILVFGGSQGANRINQAIIVVANRFSKEKEMQLIFVTGKKYFDSVKLQLAEEGLKDTKNILVLPYIDNMNQLLKNVDLIVSRSGATTLSEITAVGLASILIPSPNVTGNQQTLNAQALEKRGATKVILEDDLTPAKLFHDMKAIVLDEKKLNSLKEAAKTNGYPHASDDLYNLILDVIKNGK
ncbi:MAG: undecaprenyldiphospho-muramoylpentapeptide beta-N-acetylglucosaminyltransferase [Lactobacillaceae bacterium]|jgi:UDP-N-acetylglucosamine--N-acetylmuramyl-(pentapeptide) pyrophosphoryl-undecaprenol N-acetylglucosamine transferase|nr:undecaprenyldiphospho-muramoylpentapeptide beta-N-acetylglucosaminyltransferase [Lactobacillaceae bacterium]